MPRVRRSRSAARTGFAGLALLVVALRAASANAPPASAARVDLARLAWASPEREWRDRAPLEAALDSLRSEAAAPFTSAAQLLRVVRLSDRARRLTRWHADYYHVLAALDARDEQSPLREDSLYAAEDQVFALIRARLAALDEARLRELEAQEPGLAPYRDFLADARRSSDHPVPEGSGALVSELTAWQFPLYERLVDRTTFGTVPGPDGPLDVRRDRAAIAALPDSDVREQAFQKLAAGYAQNRDLYAFVLLRTLRAQNAAARARGYTDAPAQVYGSRQVTTDQVRALIAAVRARGAIFRRYEAAVERARAVLRGHPEPRLSLSQTREAMRAALAPLGPVYAKELDALLDPASGRLDLGPGEHRQAGGFSFALPGGVHGVYLESFGGRPAEVSRLVHESGHAMHYRMFELGGGSAIDGPAFSEAVAQFGEVLVSEYLARRAPNAWDALCWRQQALLKSLEVFLGARDAELEQSLYDGVAAGRLDSADDLDSLTAAVDSAYTSDRRPSAAGRWMRTSLLIEDPLYLSNYLYSGTLILALRRQYAADPAGFVPRFVAFMHEPSGARPDDLLGRTLDISLADPALLTDGFAMLESELTSFEHDIERAATSRR